LLASINALDFTLNGELGNIQDELKELLSVMKKSSEDMLGLVNALLEVYRYESGKLFLCKTHFSLEELIEDCTKKLSPLLKEDNLKFEFEFQKNTPKTGGEILINADKNEIRRVVSNLLGNAIKHSKKDGVIKICTSYEAKDVRVDIVDFGEGLSKEDIEKLFNRFSQGELDKGCTFSFILKNSVIESKAVL